MNLIVAKYRLVNNSECQTIFNRLVNEASCFNINEEKDLITTNNELK
jgi:hypothetical protein